MIKALLKNSSNLSKLTPSEASSAFGIQWQTELSFESEAARSKAVSMTSKAIRKKQLTEREKWLAARYHEEITRGYTPRLEIRYINDLFGYGVFAAEPLEEGDYIGEYTGLVRKRTPRIDRANDYTFEYAIGEWGRNPFIIDASRSGNITRFINHGDEPNLESLSVYANGLMHIILLATKDIEVGEQLSYHYGDIFWKKRKGASRLPLR